MYLIIAILAFTGFFLLKNLPSKDPDPVPVSENDTIDQMIADQGEEPHMPPEEQDPKPDAIPEEQISGSDENPDVIPEEQISKPDENPDTIPGQQDSESAEETEVISQTPDTEPLNVAGTGPGRTVTRGTEDYRVIPDRYNCGAKGALTKVAAGDTVSGIALYESGGINVFDFYWRNTGISGEVHLNNYDFSDYIVAIYDSDLIDRDITLVFENCRFSAFRSNCNYPKVNLVFKNCTFNIFHGSCAEFDYCKFGGSYNDGLVPFHDVTVRNCYFSDFDSNDPAGTGAHTDGTQIYGKEGVDAVNIRYDHCRFEVPIIPGPNETNACIMLQMEFSNGIGISFNDCICNGGGYSVYASAKNKGFQYYQNVVLSNIAVGQSCEYGSLYPTVSDGIQISNIHDIDSLYVASVWKQGGVTHLSVTNDTRQDRLLVVYTDGEKYEFTIPATRGGKTYYFNRFEDYPIDLDIKIDADCRYVACFDNTSGQNKQIRFISWDGSDSVVVPWE